MSVNSGTLVFAMLLEERIRGPWFSRWCLEPANSGTMVFAMVLEPANTGTMVFAMVLETANSRTMVFAIDGFGTSEFGDHGICDGFGTTSKRQKHPRVFTRAEVRVCAAYYVSTTKSRLSSHGSSGRPRRTIRLCYKSRLSSYGSSACARRTTFVLQKSTFQPRKLRASPAYYTSVLQKSTFQLRKLRVAYYVCTTKVDFPATEAPGVPCVLRLYYKTRFSSHGSPRRTTSVLHKSKNKRKKRKNTTVLAPRPRENPQRGYVCMSRNAKTRGFRHRSNAESRRGVTFVCQKTQKHHGFGTVPTPKPAEGCLQPRKKYQKRRL